jgi:fimbrial chaperone protein
MIAPRRVLPALAAAALLAPLAARAGDLEIAPILVELAEDARTALVTVKNAGRQPMRYQARAYDWVQAPDGEMVLSPASGLVVFPPVLELEAGASRNLRVGTDAAPGEQERSWRLFVEELPRADAPPEANRVQVLARVGVPVFLAPRKAAARGEVAFGGRDGARLKFAVRNVGTVRLRPRAVTFALAAKDGARVLEKALDAWYVLAGGERVYEVELPADACARATGGAAVVEVALEQGRIEARSADACRAP